MARRFTALMIALTTSFTTFANAASAAYPNGEEPTETPVVAGGAFAVTLGEETTHFPSHGRLLGRAENVRLAASHLDGSVIAPGAELSFNEIVGPRTEALGFRYAPVIANGRIRQGVGGGVCQVATTLHVAATRAGLTVLERRPHSRPSSYVEPGMDATVVEGRVDYRIQNPYDFPIAIRTKTTDTNDLLIVVTGAERAPATTFRSERVRVLPATERRVPDSTLPVGHEIVEQPGLQGLVVRVVTERDGASETSVVRYAPTPRIVRVGVSSGAVPS